MHPLLKKILDPPAEVKEKEKEVVVLCSTKREIRNFSRRSLATVAKKCTKERDARASCCFALYLIAFCRSRCCRCRRCISSLTLTPRLVKVTSVGSSVWSDSAG